MLTVNVEKMMANNDTAPTSTYKSSGNDHALDSVERGDGYVLGMVFIGLATTLTGLQNLMTFSQGTGGSFLGLWCPAGLFLAAIATIVAGNAVDGFVFTMFAIYWHSPPTPQGVGAADASASVVYTLLWILFLCAILYVRKCQDQLNAISLIFLLSLISAKCVIIVYSFAIYPFILYGLGITYLSAGLAALYLATARLLNTPEKEVITFGL